MMGFSKQYVSFQKKQSTEVVQSVPKSAPKKAGSGKPKSNSAPQKR
jgi:hypothetical protein